MTGTKGRKGLTARKGIAMKGTTRKEKSGTAQAAINYFCKAFFKAAPISCVDIVIHVRKRGVGNEKKKYAKLLLPLNFMPFATQPSMRRGLKGVLFEPQFRLSP